MKKVTILLDMDDVLQDLVGCWVSEINSKFGTHVRSEEITEWDFSKFFPELSKEELFSVIHAPEIWEKVKPIPGAYEILSRLISEDYKVLIVTAAYYFTVGPKIKHFLSMYPFLKWTDIIIAYDKSVISGDIMVDDGIQNLEATSCKKILFDRPHNRSYDAEANSMIRVKTWDDVYEAIKKLTKEIA